MGTDGIQLDFTYNNFVLNNKLLLSELDLHDLLFH